MHVCVCLCVCVYVHVCVCVRVHACVCVSLSSVPQSVGLFDAHKLTVRVYFVLIEGMPRLGLELGPTRRERATRTGTGPPRHPSSEMLPQSVFFHSQVTHHLLHYFLLLQSSIEGTPIKGDICICDCFLIPPHLIVF